MCKIPARIKMLADNEGLTIGALERSIGASKGVISRALKNGTDIQTKWIEIIVENYPRISSEWLLTGKGEMLRKLESIPNCTIAETAKVAYADREETRPRIPLNAAAGSLTSALEGGTAANCEQLPVIRAFPRYDFTILVAGDSMDPNLAPGDELACLNIRQATYIQWGRMHILDTDQGIVVKRIFDSDDCFICRSDNPLFPEYMVPKSSVYNLALVVGMLRRY